MSKLPGLSSDEVLKALRKTGFLYLPSEARAATRRCAEPMQAARRGLCRRTLRATYETISHGVLARALLRRNGASAGGAAEAALAKAAALIERTGAKTLGPALCEWRAELAAILGDDVTRAQLLQQAQQGYDEIGAPGHAARLRKELGS